MSPPSHAPYFPEIADSAKTLELVAFNLTGGSSSGAEPIARFGTEPKHAVAFRDLAAACTALLQEPQHLIQFDRDLAKLTGRRAPLQAARRLSGHQGGSPLFLLREDLSGDDRHLLLSVAGQGLIARALGRSRLVTGCRDGRRAVATATIAARLGLQARIHMDPVDIERHASIELRLRLLGATLFPVGASALRNADIREAALADWARSPGAAFLVTGLDAAPPPYPLLISHSVCAIGRECRRQVLALTGALPTAVFSRDDTTADALGTFPVFFDDADVRLACVEPAGPQPQRGADRVDPFRGSLSAAQHRRAQSILQRLEYPGVHREHAMLRNSGRVQYLKGSTAAARQAIADFSRFEGYIPPFETAHVLGAALEHARQGPAEAPVVAIVAEPADAGIWEVGRLLGLTP